MPPTVRGERTNNLIIDDDGLGPPTEEGQIRNDGSDLKAFIGGSVKSLTTGSGISEAAHNALRQLIHLADNDGPMDGFASGAFEETLPANSPFPTSSIWYEDNTKAKKIVANHTVWSGVQIVTDKYKAYAADGTTVLITLTDTYDYGPGFLTPTRTRTWVVGDA